MASNLSCLAIRKRTHNILQRLNVHHRLNHNMTSTAQVAKAHEQLSNLKYTNSFTKQLTGDPSTPGTPIQRGSPNRASRVPRQVKAAHYSFVEPEFCPDPVLISASPHAAELVDLDLSSILKDTEKTKELLGLVSGNVVPEGTNPWAMCYGGHQFGSTQLRVLLDRQNMFSKIV